MMVTIGNISQFTAFFFSMLATAFILLGVMRNDARFIESGRRGIYGLAFFTTAASFAMTYLFATDNFQVEYVASYSDKALPLYYKLTSFWAGQKGSLLLWAWILSIFSSIVAFNTRNELSSRTTPYIYLVLTGTLIFFLYLLSTISNPFDLLDFIPSDGKGLNPMLQNPGMLFHPPTLLLGYIGFTIPFAYAIAAMVTGRLDASWLRKTRIWTLISWIFLTIGIILGCLWAYIELGWGGYWAWDPVENASFIPWLVATAYLHTAIIQEKRDMMKVWNVFLILLTFVLCIFGTYLVRSGVLQSVHAFGATGLGGYFILFLVTVLLGSFYLIFESYRALRSENAIESFISRESTFLFNNVILLSISFSTLLGTIFPLLSDAVTGKKLTVGQPFFNQVNTPLFLALLLITGICPLIGWRKASADNLRKNFLVSFLSAAAAGALLFIAGVREFYPLTSFSLSIFVAITIFNEFRVGTLARKRLTGEGVLTAFPRLLWRMRSRYGGYIAHLGFIILVVGITGSSAYKLEKQATLRTGESMKIGAYELRYDDFRGHRDRNREVYTANLAVFKDGRPAGTISPERRYYINAEQPTTEVSLRRSLLEDLYVTMPGIGKDEVITLKVAVNPLLVWIWVGAAIVVIGGIIAAVPVRKKKEAANAT